LARVKELKLQQMPAQQYTDIENTMWAADSIYAVSNAGVFLGYPDKTFQPGKNVTRAEAISSLVRLIGLKAPDLNGKLPFSDVAPSHWAYKEIYTAQKNGLLDYIDEGLFAPSRSITRGELAEVISKIPEIKALFKKLVPSGYL
jgi:hypothetical protein